jgi:hypothetical protein
MRSLAGQLTLAFYVAVGAVCLIAFTRDAHGDTVIVSTVVDLYRGTSVLLRDLPSEQVCMQRADDLDVSRDYLCRTRTTFRVTADAPPPPPPPVDCVVSDWTLGPLVPATCPTSGTQSRTDARTIVTPAANGGAVCPELARTVSVTCTPAPPPPPPPTGAQHLPFIVPAGNEGRACTAATGWPASWRVGLPSATDLVIAGTTCNASAIVRRFGDVADAQAVITCNYTATGQTAEQCSGAGESSRPASTFRTATPPPPPPPPPATGSITLGWEPPTTNTNGSPLTDLAGYRIYWGTALGAYPNSITLNDPGLTAYVLNGLPAGTYYLVNVAFNAAGTASEFSNVASKTIQ